MEDNLFIMRHGHTLYKQGKVSIDEACDIVDEAKPAIRQSAIEIDGIFKGKGLEIQSTPYGRGLATAKEVYAQLQELGSKPGDIKINNELEEIRNFDYRIMHALARGGVLDLDGDKYLFDINNTNPRQLSEVQFFRQDEMHDINYSKKLPTELRRLIANMETCKSAEYRLTKVLSKIEKESVLVTHEGPTGMYAMALTENKDSYLDRAGFVQLEKVKDLWYPKYINKIGFDAYAGKDM